MGNPQGNPLKRIVPEVHEGTSEGAWTIVDVVEDVAFTGRETDARPAFYFPHAQRSMPEMFPMIRTDRD